MPKNARLRKKAAIQLSMNFLVMLIMAIVVFTFSIVFLKDFFSSATKIKAGLDEQAKLDIERMLSGDARVAIPIDKYETKPSKGIVFGIGIKNTIRYANFSVKIVESGGGNKPSGSFIGYGQPLEQIYCDSTHVCYDRPNTPKNKIATVAISNDGDLKLKTNANEIVSFLVQPTSNARSGEYIYNIRVCVNENGPAIPTTLDKCQLYDGQIHRLHVIVK